MPADSRWCSECTRDAGIPSIRRAWCLRTPLSQEMPRSRRRILTPVLLNHSSRAYTWGAAIAALHGITFDRDRLYLAAMFSTTPGLPQPRCPMSTSRSAAPRWHASSPTATMCLPLPASSLPTRSPCIYNSRRWPRIRCRGLPPICRRSRRCVRPTQQPDTRCSPPGVIQEYPRLGFKREFAPGFCEPRPSKSLVAAPGTRTASR